MSLESRTIGLVEDDLLMGESLVQRLQLEGARVAWWKTQAEAVDGLAAARPDAVVCDIRLPDGSGEGVFRTAATRPEPVPFLFMTGYGEVDEAVRLLRCGAGDYLTKPFEMSDFLARLDSLMRPAEFSDFPALGVSAPMRNLDRMIARMAKVPSNVLLTGETGAGKEVCARRLHMLRTPRPGPFIAVNCAAIPSDLMESELFGHERGAFTGAQSRHLGYAERAGEGTLFLDEIGDLASHLQSKMLRLLEERAFLRLGGEQAIPFRARLVCATNASLERLVETGRFRSDLYYRVNVVNLAVPPLRDRPDDIVWLAERFLAELADRSDAKLHGFSTLAVDALLAHAWPGNVRELRNRVERAVALSLGPWLMPGDLFPDMAAPPEPAGGLLPPLEAARDDAERRHILRALALTKGTIAPAAKALGVSRTTLWEKMRRHGISTTENSATERSKF